MKCLRSCSLTLGSPTALRSRMKALVASLGDQGPPSGRLEKTVAFGDSFKSQAWARAVARSSCSCSDAAVPSSIAMRRSQKQGRLLVSLRVAGGFN